MSLPIGQEELTKLKAFVALCSAKPEILNLPELEFFKQFIEQLGGKIPSAKFKTPSFETQTEEPKPKKESPTAATPEPAENVESESESDIELDVTGVIEADNEEPQSMGDVNKEPTEDEMDQASECRSKAAAAYSEQNYKEAIDLYTKAIELNPHNALFHAKRGQAYLKLQKPNACIRDCNRALELNCDSAAAYKFRGRAHRLLGNWELAAKDLRQACKLDFDEETDEWLKEVTPNAKKIEQHKIKQERKNAEKELKKKQERLRKAQEANKKAAHENQQQEGAPPGGFGAGLGNLFGNLNQSEILSAFSDPEISAAMKDIISNPTNIAKYQSNPKIMSLISKIGASMGAGGAGGGAGGFPGGFPGAGDFPGFGGGAGADNADNTSTKPNPKPDFSDDGLD